MLMLEIYRQACGGPWSEFMVTSSVPLHFSMDAEVME